MAIQTGIFKTPTGPIYDPAQKIERSFERTTSTITDYLGRKAQDYDQQQAMFGELANNIGEIEANLQQNYAGMQQQAIDSTREWLKQNIKSGTRANDPEFQMELGRKIGAIRAAMGNADKIREQINLEMKQIEASPYMDATGKANAIKELFSMAYNPDVLISKDPITRLSSVSKKYIDPYLVTNEMLKKIPSQGVTEVLYTDADGNQRLKQVPVNDLINPNDLFDENGRVKLSNLTPERAKELLAQNPDMVSLVDEDIKRNSPAGTPYDVAVVQSLAKFMGPVVGTQQVDKIYRTKAQLDAEAKQAVFSDQQLEYLKAQTANYNSLAASRKQQEDLDQRYQVLGSQLINGINTGDRQFLANYENIAPGKAKDFNWMYESDQKLQELGIPTYNQWKSDNTGRDKRVQIIKEYLNVDVARTVDTDTKEYYDRVVAKIKEQSGKKVTGISYQANSGTAAKPAWAKQIVPITDQQSMLTAISQLENFARATSGKVKPLVDPSGINFPETQTGATTGINLNASSRIQN